MQGHRFTTAAARVLTDAREKAWTLTHETVRPDHLLFGLARSKDRTLLQVWAHLGIDRAEIGRAALADLPAGNPESDDTHPPYSSFSKRVIEYAMREASALNDDTVEPTHILLGVMQLGDDTVAHVLRKRAVTADRVRTTFGDLRGGSLPLTTVLAAVIEQDDRYLVCQRPAHKRHGTLWEFPGGKLEPGETHFEAARRELAEELDVRVLAVGSALFSITDPGSEFLIEFVPTTIEGNPKCLEHIEVRWLPLPDLSSLELAPSDRRFVEFLRAART